MSTFNNTAPSGIYLDHLNYFTDVKPGAIKGDDFPIRKQFDSSVRANSEVAT